MNCKNLHKKLIFFLEGDLPKNESEQIQLHLTECEECALFFEDMKNTLSIIEDEKLPEVNPFFYTRLKARIENQESAETDYSRRPVFARILQPVVFSILLLIGVYSGFKVGQSKSVQVANNTSSEQEIIPYLNEMKTESIEAFLME